FFCLASAYLRHLHSFPTRRSSELSNPGFAGGSSIETDRPMRPTADRSNNHPSTRPRGHARLTGDGCGTVPCPATSRSSSLCGGIDRKSTRLNSSHEWISYAVFCLK